MFLDCSLMKQLKKGNHMNNDTLLLRLGGVIGILQDGDKTPEAIKAINSIMAEVEEDEANKS